MRIPRTLGWSQDLGIVVLEALLGDSLKARMLAGQGIELGATEILTLLEMFPQATDGAPPAHDITATARHHYRMLIDIADPQISAATEGLIGHTELRPPQDERWIHGDFHIGQIMVGADGRVALVDVDRAGIGDPLDDIATFIAHLFDFTRRRPNPAASKLMMDLLDAAYEKYGRVETRATVSAVMLALSTGAYARQEPDWKAQVLSNLEDAATWATSLA